MNNKIIAVLSILALLFLFAFFFQDRIISIFNLGDTYKMRGVITRVTNDSIFVKGAYKNAKNGSSETDGLKEFYFNSKTVYVNKATLISKIPPKGIFSPKTENRTGTRADLTLGQIVQLEYKNKLFQKNKAVASRVEYSTLQYEK